MGAHLPITSGRNSPLTAGLCGQVDFPTADAADDRPTLWIDGWIAGPFGSDASALTDAWAAKGSQLLDQAYGDFALVLRDSARQRLFLARSPLSSRPLFFRREAASVRVAALAHQLVGEAAVDLEAAAEWYAALVGSTVAPMFIGVEKVEPGTVVEVDRQGAIVRRFWDPRLVATQKRSLGGDLAAALRDALTSAVGDAVDRGTNVASLLSSGRDSSCVSALAARYLQEAGKTLHCYTASPGFASNDHLIDEAPGARLVAARYPNIIHRIVTPRNVRFCEEAEAFARVHSAPLGNPISLHWWLAAQRQAVADGCDTLLTGGVGNLSISDGGPQYLADLFNAGRLLSWRAAAVDVASFEGASWLNIANISIGGLLPPTLYRWAQALHSRRLKSAVSPYLGRRMRETVEQAHRRQDQRPPRFSKRRGAELLAEMELGDVAPDLMFGLRMLDPAADRRVVEVALSIPPELLVSRYDRRPIFELAFGDLLPEGIVRAPRRAYQSMDWNFAYDFDELRAGLARYRQHVALAELLDFQAMERGLDRWPVGRLASLEETADLGEGLLRAFALAAFLSVHLPG